MFYIHITPNQLYDLFENTSMSVLDAYVNPLNDVMERYQINTDNRIAMFLAQTGHESGRYKSTRIVESLNYKVSALNALFSRRISATDAARYGRDDATKQKANEESIANAIYGGEWGKKNLGNELPGDGWKFRGRGLIQLTGRSNYQRFATAIGKTIEDAAAYVETPKGACEAAGWFWKVNDLNRFADNGDIVGCTKKVNGGDHGLAEREELYRDALRILRS